MSAAVGLDVKELAECVRAAGVVGAGGGGFALADKLLAGPYHTLIINAAQSEPLICKDWAVLAQFPECVLDGAQRLAASLGVGKSLLAVRDEFLPHLPGLAALARRYGVTLARLPDQYPLGYEKILKRELLGIPLDDARAACVLVINAETVRNLSWAARLQRPLCSKLVSVAGAVAQPITLSVPIGTPFSDCLAQAGGANCAHYTVFRNGVLAGQPVDPELAWVDATTLGFVLLPAWHSAVQTPSAGDLMSERLNERRKTFFSTTLAGRLQAMSAACALFDLTSFRKPRPLFRAARSVDRWPERVRICPLDRTGGLEPCVEPGAVVKRGQLIAVQPGHAGLRLHASVDGVVESTPRDGITIRRTFAKDTPR